MKRQTNNGLAVAIRSIGKFVTAALLTLGISIGSGAQAESTLYAAHPWTPDTLDPALMKLGGSEYNFAYLVYNSLTSFNNDLTVRPDLAESWEANEDLTVWTFHLRTGVKFHHGREMDAEDVIASYERIIAPDSGSVLAADLGMIETMEAVDSHTLRITLKQPYAAFPAIVAANQAKILPRDRLETIATEPVGTGPFRFIEYLPGDRIVMARNEQYFEEGMPKLDQVIFTIIPEYASAVAALEAGSVHIVWQIPPEESERLKASSTAHADVIPSGSWYAIALNAGMPPFDNVELRKAFMGLFDKPAFTDLATFGYGTPTHTALPPYHPFYDSDLPMAAADPAAAAEAIAAVGLAEPLELTYWYPKDTAYLERLGVALRDVAQQAGITINLSPAPDDKFYAEIEGQQPLYGTSFSGRTTPDTMLYAWYHSSGSWNKNLWKYSNAEVDEILDKARQSTSEEEQNALYRRFQEIIVEDGPGAAIFVANHANGVHNSVVGFEPSPLLWLDLRGVTLSE